MKHSSFLIFIVLSLFFHLLLLFFPRSREEGKESTADLLLNVRLTSRISSKAPTGRREEIPKTFQQGQDSFSERNVSPEPSSQRTPAEQGSGEKGEESFNPAEVVGIDIIYPYLSRKRGEEGDVWAEAVIGRDGRLIDVVIVKSSGYDRLDHAVLEGLRRSRARPATENGLPVQSRLLLGPFQFRLKE